MNECTGIAATWKPDTQQCSTVDRNDRFTGAECLAESACLTISAEVSGGRLKAKNLLRPSRAGCHPCVLPPLASDCIFKVLTPHNPAHI
jgi:hypothetical protein